MISRRSSRPLQDAGSCAEQIALLRFTDGITFETKLGDLGTLLSFSRIDPDCPTDEVLNVACLEPGLSRDFTFPSRACGGSNSQFSVRLRLQIQKLAKRCLCMFN
jgi:hypothetical protein